MFVRVFLVVAGLALSASGPAHADNDRHIEVRDGDAFKASHHEHDGRRHDEERGDPEKRPEPQPTVGASGPAPVPLPAGKASGIRIPGTKRFDLASLFGRHAKPADRISTAPKPVLKRAIPSSLSPAVSGSSPSAAPGETSVPPAVAAVPKPSAPRSPVWPLALLAAGAGVLAAAGHALLRGPRIRAEGTIGPSHVEKPEFDASAPPAIGFIVSPGKPAVSLTFDKTASGETA